MNMPHLNPVPRNPATSVRRAGTRNARHRHAGFTLVELLVAVSIGMAMVLAITLMLIRSEAGRRAITSINDVSSGGAYLSFVMDRSIRSAGSGYAQAWNTAAGCQLAVARSGTQVLPRAAAFPAPFAALPQTQRLMPLVVYAGAGANGSDVLAIYTGSSGLGESPLKVLPGSATGTGVRVPATIGLRGGDLGLVVQDDGTCLMQEVAVGFVGAADQQLNFSGTYAATSVGAVKLETAGALHQGLFTPLGNVTGNRPNFSYIGISANNTLVSYDVLQLDGTDTPTPIADGVADMRVLLGVDSDDDGRVDAWVSPAAAPWNAATLNGGNATALQSANRILSVRVGLLLSNSSPERGDVSSTDVSLFADLGTLKYTRTLSAADRKLRWRSLDFTVPLRNVILRAPPPTP
jgi:type IV pilus assembly protein PilW